MVVFQNLISFFFGKPIYILEACVSNRTLEVFSLFFPSVFCPQAPVYMLEIRHCCRLLKETYNSAIPVERWADWLSVTAWLRAVCLSAFACELQITAQHHRACSRQRQGFTLSSAPRGCLWVLCHMTLTEIDPLHTSRSCCATRGISSDDDTTISKTTNSLQNNSLTVTWSLISHLVASPCNISDNTSPNSFYLIVNILLFFKFISAVTNALLKCCLRQSLCTPA